MSIKYWAETKEDNQNFRNYCKASGAIVTNDDDSDVVNANALFFDGHSITHQYADLEYFEENENKEFFFPIPGPLLSDEVDMVNNPSHYTSHPSGIECIDVTRHMSFNLGNATKYIWRCDLKKDAIEDLKKAVFYLNDEIKLRESKVKPIDFKPIEVEEY